MRREQREHSTGVRWHGENWRAKFRKRMLGKILDISAAREVGTNSDGDRGSAGIM
jgi:hypothetical protein